MTNNKEEDKLFGFTRDQIFEAIREFQSMEPNEAQKFLRSSLLAKAIMMGDIGKKEEPKDD